VPTPLAVCGESIQASTVGLGQTTTLAPVLNSCVEPTPAALANALTNDPTAPRLVVQPRVPRAVGISGLWKVIRYRDLLQSASEVTGADSAILAALMEVEGSEETAVSPAGALGVMQLLPDKFRDGDDPFDPAVNILRAAQFVRRLQSIFDSPSLVAAAYFGAIDPRGNVTNESDGNVTGHQYVALFRQAYRRYAAGTVQLPSWLASPLGDLDVTDRMIAFGFLADYGSALAHEIRGQAGVDAYGTLHLALDLVVRDLPQGGRGVPVVAPFDGKIIRTSDAAGGPFGIWLENDLLNLRARLMHMDGLVDGVETGVKVKAGQQLGVLGAQGTEGFPHLHLAFERMSDGARINPAHFYRLHDGSDPATQAGRWLDTPVDAPIVAANDAPRVRALAALYNALTRRDGRLLMSRWGPFELSEP
jgi:murein DD-endopeptidase MepM/ murein hydrolase activator NlpD